MTSTRYNACSEAGQRVTPMLATKLNLTRCLFYACLYATGIVNQYGLGDTKTAYCILGLFLFKSESKKKKIAYKVVFGSLGA